MRKKEISGRFKMPYKVLSWFLDENEKDEFTNLKTRRSELSVPERVQRLVAAMVTELEDRIFSHTHRKSLAAVELVAMVKNATAIQKNMEETEEGTGTVMTIVSHMPKKDDPEDDGGETVH